ncbi:hypothetical protein SNE40_000705 [Patella caerulea]|uniref:Transporter n=1 Tax=Patella caerulea TaxID=87958 RepID=A0AAN8KB19_PATCE
MTKVEDAENSVNIKGGHQFVMCSGDIANTKSQPKRDTWSNRFDFVISCVGAAVGFGNVWRFPYLCYKNGGGAFLIPYLIAVVTVGFPIKFLEVSLGQFMQQGGIGMWNICPLMKGVAVCTSIFAFLELAYYVVIFAWVLLYLGSTFSDPLPWSNCNNTWNTVNCFAGSSDNGDRITENSTFYNWTYLSDTNITNVTGLNLTLNRIDPSVEFWRHYVLEITDGLDEPGVIVWKLLLCLLAIYIVVYFCTWKGIKWISKIAYVTATAPYVLLTILLIVGAMKEGAVNGIIFYLKPDITKLAKFKVWYAAFSQVMFSYAVGLNMLPALGSYNKFNNNCYSHTIIVAFINSFTSLFSGFVIFTLLGHMAYLQQVPIDEVASSGPGLVFNVYPRALAELPVPQLWCCVFFLMLAFIGIDSAILILEGFACSVMDVYTNLARKREAMLILTCVATFILGLPMITQGGMYVFQLVDYYLFGGILMWLICFMEVIGIGWIYGADRFYDNLELMMGFRINIWVKLCWIVITPMTLLIFLTYQLVTFEPLVYDKMYVYPPWGNALGICLSVMVLMVIPCVMVYSLIKLDSRHGTTMLQRIKYLLRPKLKAHQIPDSWGSKAYTWTDTNRNSL